MLIYAFRYDELLTTVPTVSFLGQSNFVDSERCTVCCMRICFVWRTETNDALQNNNGRFARRVLKALHCSTNGIQIVGILDCHCVPSESLKFRGRIFRKCQIRFTFDRDVIVVINPAEVIQFQVTSNRCCFATDSFHEVAIGAKYVYVVIKEIRSVSIKTCGFPFGSHGHANTCANTLA